MQAAGFEFGCIMIDKSEAEMAACRALDIKFLLCIFHAMQANERFCKSHKSGVQGVEKKGLRLRIYAALRGVMHSATEPVFKANSEAFKQRLTSGDLGNYPALVKYYVEEWESCAERWAKFGRHELEDLQSDTNNLAESTQYKIKYHFSGKKVGKRIDDVVRLLLNAMQHYLADRLRKHTAMVRTEAEAVDDAYAKRVEWVQNLQNGVHVVDDKIGRCRVRSANKSCPFKSHDTVVGDLSCDYGASGVCHHLHAASNKFPYTSALLTSTASVFQEKHTSGEKRHSLITWLF